MIVSLALKMSTVHEQFEFGIARLFPLLDSAEIVMLTCFALVKNDEDCFRCFNRIEACMS